MPRNTRTATPVADAEAQAAYEALLNAPLDAEQAEAIAEVTGEPVIIADLGPVVEENGEPTPTTIDILAGTPVRPGFCVCCRTRRIANPAETAHGVDLCVRCYDEAGFENAHSDGHHDDAPDANCHVCQGTDPHAGIRAAGVGAGRVASAADGRLKENAPSVPENASRVKLVGVRCGLPNARYGSEAHPLMAQVIKTSTHTWKGYTGDWYCVLPEGQSVRRWFWASDVKTVRAPRAPRVAA